MRRVSGAVGWTVALAACSVVLAVGCGGGDRDPGGKLRAGERASGVPAIAGAVRTGRPAASFAPLVWLHPREPSFPIGALRFLERSSLKWRDRDCFSLYDVATGRIADRKTVEDVPRLDPARLSGRGARPYRWRGTDRLCARRVGRVYRSDERTRPFDRGARAVGLPPKSGFYLDLLSDSRDGDATVVRRGSRRVVAGVPAYYQRDPVRVGGRPGVRLTYWMLYPHDESFAADGDEVEDHEGDWERFEVVARRGRREGWWVPVSARFVGAARARSVRWRRLERSGTHPVVYAARSSHAPYPAPGRYERRVRARERPVVVVDRAARCGDCPLWRTWAALRPLRRQRWHGFGGGWGLAWGGPQTSGPLGPVP